ncbi:MAG: cadherin-like beta sandwich domain-containing protein, partial [Clostridia bacterium]
MKNKTRRITALLVMVCIMAANFIFVSEVHAANTVDTAYASCQRISAGGFHSLALKSDGTVVGWGYNNYQQTTIPVGLSDVGAIAAGYNHSLALKSDGTVVGWGYNVNGETTIPWGLSDVVAIAAGNFHSLALKSNGTVDGWGNNDYGQTTIPTGLSDVGAIAAGYKHSLALKSNGTVDGWGYNNYGQATIPWGLSDVVAIAAGGSHSLALKSDGTVAGWGFNDDGQTTIPWGLSDVVAIAAGGSHSLALKSDGTVAGWGSNNNGQTTIPSGLSDVVAIAAGSFHSLALKSDGTVIGWGFNDDGQTTIPTGLNLSPRLSNLFVKSQLLPGFDPNILDYNLPDVANSVAELSVMPILEYPGNTNLTVNGTVKDSATTTTIPLNVGDNTIEIKVDFKDEELARTYTLHIRRDLPSVTNAHLDNLTINTGILTPNFDSDTENYSVSVDNVVANIEISLTPADSLAVASVNGLGGGTGTQMISVPLDEGDNDLVISVRASDNTTIKTYTLHITRGPSSNADLVGLSVNGGTLNPVFTPKTVSYAVTGIGGVSSVNIIAIGDKPGLTLTINGEAAQ